MELIVGIAMCVLMYRVADADDQSGIMWFGVTFALCFVAVAGLPDLPFLRLFIAGAVSFILMIVHKMQYGK